MIKIVKNGKEMEVRTQLQASAFLNNGWKIKEEVPNTDGTSVVNAQNENTDVGEKETQDETPSEISGEISLETPTNEEAKKSRNGRGK